MENAGSPWIEGFKGVFGGDCKGPFKGLFKGTIRALGDLGVSQN